MFNFLILGLLFIYYWYFYTSYSKPVPKPTTGAPLKAEQLKPSFEMQFKHQFTIKVDGHVKWHHMLPKEHYVLSNLKIIPKDVCYGIASGKTIEAKGETLYNYLKNEPDTTLNAVYFHENVTPYTVQQGNVYYFTCINNRIKQLNICPSGTIFRNSKCIDINMCTNKPDYVKFAGPTITTFIKCKSGRESRIHSCTADMFFYHDRCVRMEDLAHRCKFYNNVPLLLDETTRIECRNGKPIRIKCPPGTKFFDKDYCEPTHCVGKPDYEKLPLPEQKIDPFHFIPGYRECLGGKVSRIVECPQTWDDSLSKGDNLTFLPMVFNGTECSIPEFSKNVFSNDPEVLVPVHEFTKHLKNWKFSDSYDRAVGYDRNRKRKILLPNMRIGKRFKPEPACEAQLKLPIYQQPSQYYDCDHLGVVTCPNQEFFNGVKCEKRPLNAFEFQNIPIFSFDSLNHESWINPPDYSTDPSNEHLCQEFTYIKLYNVCSHPDCINYAFLSMIPDLAILLPSDQQAKCRFDEATKRLVKEEVMFPYSFWDQKLTTSSNVCTPGQKLQTGNFIWDSTVFATCDPDHPFIFCPSIHSGKIELFNNTTYACAPPSGNRAIVNGADWTLFTLNELKHIFPESWNGNPQYIKLNKGDKSFRDLPQDGLEIPLNMKINLQSLQPIQVEFRFRVTYPPNVAFEYDQTINPRIAPATHGFLVKKNDFTNKSLHFPRYQFEKHVDSIIGNHLV